MFIAVDSHTAAIICMCVFGIYIMAVCPVLIVYDLRLVCKDMNRTLHMRNLTTIIIQHGRSGVKIYLYYVKKNARLCFMPICPVIPVR